PGSWAEAGGRAGGSPGPSEGESRPASRGRDRPAEQMEIGPLQRMAREPDVELFKDYHSYAVRTSPVTPATDYEEEQFPEHEPPSPEPRGDPQRRGGTPALPQEREREEKPVVVVEAKPELPRPKEPQQRPSPERRAMSRAEPLADRKTEARALGRTEPKAGAKRSLAAPVTAAVMAAQKAEECEEGPNTIVICMVILLNIGLAILFVHFLT
ncbi:JPH2 protein, partial [Smithornis capensis]|nr:JPH2 protein [Smithornis capensis]